MRGGSVVLILVMLLSAPWLSVHENVVEVSPSIVSIYTDLIHEEAVAVPGGLHHSNFVNYSDVAVVINNRSS